MEENKLTGPLPTELGLLSNAYQIVLHDNQISGIIASELGQMNNLLGLYLSSNNLNGSIPTELGLLGKDVESLSAFDVQGLPKGMSVGNRHADFLSRRGMIIYTIDSLFTINCFLPFRMHSFGSLQ